MTTDINDTGIRHAVTELIGRVSSRLPPDILRALRLARGREAAASHARSTLDIIIENADLAATNHLPMCQDTGTLTFYGRLPPAWNQRVLERNIHHAVRIATRRGYLRQNTIDALSGASIGDNVAPGTAPIFHWEPARATTKRLELYLLMKGGGCENMSAQYSLPVARLEADRDLEGVRRCILDAVVRAQGYGCAPGMLGVCIGGDRAVGYETAKRLFLRPLSQRANDPVLAGLERRILKEANSLNIGPMGMGGRTTLLDVKIDAAARLPASFFVTIAYMCWALRRGGARIASTGNLDQWL